MSKPIIAIPADIKQVDGAEWHAAQTQYLNAALKVAGVMSLIVPAFETGNEVDAILDRVDGLSSRARPAMCTPRSMASRPPTPMAPSMPA